MSFDLRFYRTEGSTPLAPAELKRFCIARAEFQEPVSVDNGRGMWCVYENAKTGTTFVLEYDDPAATTGDDKTVTPQGFVETGLSFNINFGRPPSHGRDR